MLHLGARVCESTFWRSRRRHRPARCRLTSAHRVKRAADRRLGCAERLEDQDFELAQSCHTAGTKRNTGLFPFRVRSVACAANKGSSVHASCHARRMARNRSRHVASCVPRGIVWHRVCRVASSMPRGIEYAAWHRVCRVTQLSYTAPGACAPADAASPPASSSSDVTVLAFASSAFQLS